MTSISACDQFVGLPSMSNAGLGSAGTPHADPRDDLAVEVEVDHSGRAGLAVQQERLRVREGSVLGGAGRRCGRHKAVLDEELAVRVEPHVAVRPQQASELSRSLVVVGRDLCQRASELLDRRLAMARRLEDLGCLRSHSGRDAECRWQRAQRRYQTNREDSGTHSHRDSLQA